MEHLYVEISNETKIPNRMMTAIPIGNGVVARIAAQFNADFTNDAIAWIYIFYIIWLRQVLPV